MTTRPAPDFALSFSNDAVHLLEREAGAAPDAPGWRERGAAAFGAPDFRDAMSRLRAIAAAGADAPVQLIIPDDQILYTSLPVREPSDPQAAVGAALDGLTPYAVDDLAWDWRPEDAGAGVRVAAVARQTLREAEAFARRHGFSAAAFVADPAEDLFPATPHFDGAGAETLDPASMDEEDDAMATLPPVPDDGSADDPGILSDEDAREGGSTESGQAAGSADAAAAGPAERDAEPAAAEAEAEGEAAQSDSAPAAEPAGDALASDSGPAGDAAQNAGTAPDPGGVDVPDAAAAAPLSPISAEPVQTDAAVVKRGATAAAAGAGLASGTASAATVRRSGPAAIPPAAQDRTAGPQTPRRIAAMPAPDRHPGARGGIGGLLVMVGALLLGLALIWAFATPDAAPEAPTQPQAAPPVPAAESAGPGKAAAPAQTTVEPPSVSAVASPDPVFLVPVPAAPVPAAETMPEPAGDGTLTPPPTPTLAADPVAPAASLPAVPAPAANAAPEAAATRAEPAAGIPAPRLELPSAPPVTAAAPAEKAQAADEPVAAMPEATASGEAAPAATGATPASSASAIDAAVAAALSEGAVPAATTTEEPGTAVTETAPAVAPAPQTGTDATAPAASAPATTGTGTAPAPRLSSPLSGGPPPRRPAKAAQPQPVPADAPPAVPGRKATAAPGARRPPARPASAALPSAASRPARAETTPAASKPAARPQGAPAAAVPATRPRPRPVEEGSADESVTAAEMTPSERHDADRLLAGLYAAHPHLPRLAPARPADAVRHAEARPAKRPAPSGRTATDATIDAAVKEAMTPRKARAAEPAAVQKRRAASDAPEAKPRQNASPVTTARNVERGAGGNRPLRRPSRGGAGTATTAAVEAAIAQAVEQSGATPGGVRLSALRSSPLPVRKPVRSGSGAAPAADAQAEAVAALAGSRPAMDRTAPASAPVVVPDAPPVDAALPGAGDPGQRLRMDEQLQAQAEARARARAQTDAQAEAQARAAAEARARAQAAAEERAAIAKRGEYRPPEVDDEPEIATTASFSAASGDVARSATVGGMDLGKTQVIGVIGAGRASRGLIRLRNGKIVTVRLGDRIDGGAINSIGNGRISYVKSGRQYNLPILNGR